MTFIKCFLLSEQSQSTTYSHGQKYWHPCTSPRKLLQLQMLRYSCLFILFALEKHKKSEEKKQICYHSTQNSKNGLDKIIGTLNLIFGSTPFGKNNWDQSLPVTINEFFYTTLLEFWTTLLLPTAPGVSDLKGAFSHLLFWDLSTGVLWDIDLDLLLATSELSSMNIILDDHHQNAVENMNIIFSWEK